MKLSYRLGFILVAGFVSLGDGYKSLNPPDYSATSHSPAVIPLGMDIDHANSTIPHRRTMWDELQSTVAGREREYLKTVLPLVDQAVLARVVGVKAFSARRFEQTDFLQQMDMLIDFLNGFPVPTRLAGYHKNLVQAIIEQQAFFKEWQTQGDKFQFSQQLGNHPQVRKSSANLQAAYQALMSAFPEESPQNKNAFFDYHCALDFL